GKAPRQKSGTDRLKTEEYKNDIQQNIGDGSVRAVPDAAFFGKTAYSDLHTRLFCCAKRLEMRRPLFR
ncbi:MAG: hypothetical protein IIW12_07315, partial [Oscillospiraceae bacterium]|nr:hypothetical protein [Oscillospiraceae bacterium]